LLAKQRQGHKAFCGAQKKRKKDKDAADLNAAQNEVEVALREKDVKRTKCTRPDEIVSDDDWGSGSDWEHHLHPSDSDTESEDGYTECQFCAEVGYYTHAEWVPCPLASLFDCSKRCLSVTIEMTKNAPESSMFHTPSSDQATVTEVVLKTYPLVQEARGIIGMKESALTVTFAACVVDAASMTPDYGIDKAVASREDRVRTSMAFLIEALRASAHNADNGKLSLSSLCVPSATVKLLQDHCCTGSPEHQLGRMTEIRWLATNLAATNPNVAAILHDFEYSQKWRYTPIDEGKIPEYFTHPKHAQTDNWIVFDALCTDYDMKGLPGSVLSCAMDDITKFSHLPLYQYVGDVGTEEFHLHALEIALLYLKVAGRRHIPNREVLSTYVASVTIPCTLAENRDECTNAVIGQIRRFQKFLAASDTLPQRRAHFAKVQFPPTLQEATRIARGMECGADRAVMESQQASQQFVSSACAHISTRLKDKRGVSDVFKNKKK
jgi:hypothetical protein